MGLDEVNLAIDRYIKENFPQSETIRYVSIIDSLCDSNGCVTYLGDDKKTGISSWDYGHLTPVASKFFVENSLLSEIAE